MNAGFTTITEAASSVRGRVSEFRESSGGLGTRAGEIKERVAKIDRSDLPDLPSRNQVYAGLLAIALLFGTYNFWFKDSSLVAVENVTINGDGGNAKLRSELERISLSMTTLNVDHSRFDAVVAKYTSIERITADPSFPNDMTVDVEFHTPIAYVDLRGQAVGVAWDGTLLKGLEVKTDKVPLLDSKTEKGSAKGSGIELLAALEAAPAPLLKQAEHARWDKIAGPTVELQGGLELRFGASTRISDKWKSAAAVLADPGLKSASYVDLTVPERPAVGGAG